MLLSLVGFIIICVAELQAIRYGVWATVMENGFDLTKAAVVSLPHHPSYDWLSNI